MCAAWAFAYLIQGIFAPDMYFSTFGSFIIFTFNVLFLLGEYLGAGKHINELEFTCTTPGNQGFYLSRLEKQLYTIQLLLGIAALVSAIRYYFLLKGFSTTQDAMLVGVREQIMTETIAVPADIRLAMIFSYTGVIFSLVYWIVFRWRLLLVLPALSVLLLGISQAGRTGILIVFFQIYITIYLKDMLRQTQNSIRKLSKRSFYLIGISFFLFLGGQSLRTGIVGEYTDILRNLEQLRSYLFGGISAFAYYVDHWMLEVLEYPALGRFTFASLYDFLGIHKQVPGIYTQYAPISDLGDSSNIFTAFRPILDDFSVGSVFLICLTGFICGRLLLGTMSNRMSCIGPLIGMYSWALFSPMLSISCYNSFLASILIPALVFSILLKPALRSRMSGHLKKAIR